MDRNDLIRKWLAGELSPEESEAFEALEEASFYKEIISDAAAFKAPGLSGSAVAPTPGNSARENGSPLRKPNWVRPLMRIASALILGLALYYFLFQQNVVRVETGVGEKMAITLPDASTVRLNALSEIAFNEGTWDTKREVTLEGEAFFDVARGARFDVVSPAGRVSVLGTEFNVRHRGRIFEVHCFEGQVKVISGSHERILRAGDHLKISNGVVSSGKNTYALPQWTRNLSDFQREPLAEVFDELERQYQVRVTLVDVDGDQLFTGGFIHGDLELALKSITEPMELEYSIGKNNDVRVKPREK
jgi:ferric-dicitrate binding protein FerR (iron transport regulator)